MKHHPYSANGTARLGALIVSVAVGAISCAVGLDFDEYDNDCEGPERFDHPSLSGFCSGTWGEGESSQVVAPVDGQPAISTAVDRVEDVLVVASLGTGLRYGCGRRFFSATTFSLAADGTLTERASGRFESDAASVPIPTTEPGCDDYQRREFTLPLEAAVIDTSDDTIAVAGGQGGMLIANLSDNDASDAQVVAIPARRFMPPAPGRSCVAGTCVSDTSACARHADCAAGLLCTGEAGSKQCTEPSSCTSDVDCPGDTLCRQVTAVTSRCVAPCAFSADCPGHERCARDGDTGERSCLIECGRLGLSCDRGERCVQGRCASTCTDNNDCVQDRVCVDTDGRGERICVVDPVCRGEDAPIAQRGGCGFGSSALEDGTVLGFAHRRSGDRFIFYAAAALGGLWRFEATGTGQLGGFLQLPIAAIDVEYDALTGDIWVLDFERGVSVYDASALDEAFRAGEPVEPRAAIAPSLDGTALAPVEIAVAGENVFVVTGAWLADSASVANLTRLHRYAWNGTEFSGHFGQDVGIATFAYLGALDARHVVVGLSQEDESSGSTGDTPLELRIYDATSAADEFVLLDRRTFSAANGRPATPLRGFGASGGRAWIAEGASLTPLSINVD